MSIQYRYTVHVPARWCGDVVDGGDGDVMVVVVTLMKLQVRFLYWKFKFNH
jgi:hypothetical protein